MNTNIEVAGIRKYSINCLLLNFLQLQVQDLRVASPATVSRCGMVFVDPGELKWMPYVKTWMKGVSKKVSTTRYCICQG